MSFSFKDLWHRPVILKTLTVSGEEILAMAPVKSDGSNDAPMSAIAYGGSGATATNIPSAASDALLKAANASRVGLVISNDSTAILYVLLGTGVASATNYTYALPAKGTVAVSQVISGYTGMVRGIWGSANGFAMVTEIS